MCKQHYQIDFIDPSKDKVQVCGLILRVVTIENETKVTIMLSICLWCIVLKILLLLCLTSVILSGQSSSMLKGLIKEMESPENVIDVFIHTIRCKRPC